MEDFELSLISSFSGEAFVDIYLLLTWKSLQENPTQKTA
jgi:hypothetical protein